MGYERDHGSVHCLLAETDRNDTISNIKLETRAGIKDIQGDLRQGCEYLFWSEHERQVFSDVTAETMRSFKIRFPDEMKDVPNIGYLLDQEIRALIYADKSRLLLNTLKDLLFLR